MYFIVSFSLRRMGGYHLGEGIERGKFIQKNSKQNCSHCLSWQCLQPNPTRFSVTHETATPRSMLSLALMRIFQPPSPSYFPSIDSPNVHCEGKRNTILTATRTTIPSWQIMLFCQELAFDLTTAVPLLRVICKWKWIILPSFCYMLLSEMIIYKTGNNTQIPPALISLSLANSLILHEDRDGSGVFFRCLLICFECLFSTS